MDNRDIVERIDQAQMVLVGLGEEFDDTAFLSRSPEYGRGWEILKREGFGWLFPAWNEFCGGKLGESRQGFALEKLARLLENKNYFVVSVSADSRIGGNPWKKDRLMMPCGTTEKKQCAGGCTDVLTAVTQTDRERMEEVFGRVWEGFPPERGKVPLGVCPECGSPLVLNYVRTEHYNESGYLDQWQLYRKWLQGTLNRRLLVLELGVGMEYPSVIRWPFEKAAFFNRKAYFCRVNEKLYQLAEELAGKGCGISQNAIDWLEQL